MESGILKNNGIKIVTKISEMLDGRRRYSRNLTIDDMIYFRYASITSVNVERSFTSYKLLLTDRCLRLFLKHQTNFNCTVKRKVFMQNNKILVFI